MVRSSISITGNADVGPDANAHKDLPDHNKKHRKWLFRLFDLIFFLIFCSLWSTLFDYIEIHSRPTPDVVVAWCGETCQGVPDKFDPNKPVTSILGVVKCSFFKHYDEHVSAYNYSKKKNWCIVKTKEYDHGGKAMDFLGINAKKQVVVLTTKTKIGKSDKKWFNPRIETFDPRTGKRKARPSIDFGSSKYIFAHPVLNRFRNDEHAGFVLLNVKQRDPFFLNQSGKGYKRYDNENYYAMVKNDWSVIPQYVFDETLIFVFRGKAKVNTSTGQSERHTEIWLVDTTTNATLAKLKLNPYLSSKNEIPVLTKEDTLCSNPKYVVCYLSIYPLAPSNNTRPALFSIRYTLKEIGSSNIKGNVYNKIISIDTDGNFDVTLARENSIMECMSRLTGKIDRLKSVYDYRTSDLNCFFSIMKWTGTWFVKLDTSGCLKCVKRIPYELNRPVVARDGSIWFVSSVDVAGGSYDNLYRMNSSGANIEKIDRFPIVRGLSAVP